jgi:hypothetical protein
MEPRDGTYGATKEQFEELISKLHLGPEHDIAAIAKLWQLLRAAGADLDNRAKHVVQSVILHNLQMYMQDRGGTASSSRTE